MTQIKTRLDEVAKTIEDLMATVNSDDAVSLCIEMDEYEERYGQTTLRKLRAVPGFRKLWDAIEAGAHKAADKVFSDEE